MSIPSRQAKLHVARKVKRWRHGSLGLLALLIALLAAPAAMLQAQTNATATPAPASNSDDWARVKAEGQLIVGTSADYRPFEFYNSDFELDGFDIALMREVGERLGLEIVWNDFAFSGLLDALNLGQVDAAIGAISVTPDRAAKVDFTSLYLSANDAALVRVGDGITVRSPSDFGGHTLGVELGTTYQSWAQKNLVDTGVLTQDELVPFDSVDSMVAALEGGNVDIALLGYAPAQQIDRSSSALTVGGTKFNTQQFAIAVRPGSTLINHLNVALAEVMTDGTWDDLITQYLSVDSATVLPPPGEDGTQALVPTATPPAAATTSTTPAATASATDAAAIVVTTPTATASVTPVPATATPLPTVPPTSTTMVCVNGLGYVADMNLDDQNMTAPPVMSPGQNFTKTWRVRNTGNCDWAADFLLMYVNGNRPEAQMGAQPVAVGKVVAPGQEVDLSVNMTAPYSYGAFQAFFQMRDNKGVYFGQVVWAGVSVPDPNPPTPTAVPTTAPPVDQSPNPNFRVDNPYISAGQCTALRWDVDNVSAVFFIDGGNRQGKGGHDAQTVCPRADNHL
jgi:ABC-type amino acid transport substrate-binding protein